MTVAALHSWTRCCEMIADGIHHGWDLDDLVPNRFGSNDGQ